MKIGTLFSGIGSPEQGAKRVYDDLELVFACEWDKYARESFTSNYEIENKHFHKNIADMDGTQYKNKVDIVIGGSPCQDFSLAGLRKGIDGNRGILIYEYIRIIQEVEPPIFIYENVKGMLSDKGGKTIKDFVQAFREMGYHCHYEVLNTKDYGVPQNRERIFLVGFKDSEHYHNFSFAPKIKLEKRLKDILEDDVEEKYYLNKPFKEYNQQSQGNTLINVNKECNTLMAGTHGYCQGYIKEPNCTPIGKLDIKGNESIKRVYSLNGSSPTLTTKSGGNTEPKIQVPSATKKGYEIATPGDSINLTHPQSTTHRGRVGKQVSQTLDCACNQAVVEPQLKQIGIYKKEIIKRTNETPKEINQFLKDNKGRYTLKQISELTDIKKTTIDHYFRTDKSRAIPSADDWDKLKEVLKFDGSYDEVVKDTISKISTFESTSRVYNDEAAPTLTCVDSSLHNIDYRIRKLTPRECFRLQDFPDDFRFVVSNTQLYKQAGNSISVNIMEMIFKQIEKSRDERQMIDLFSFVGVV
jgi:DNA (cytosine-5)-methyltransferase 1